MAVADGDIKRYLTGGAGNTDPNASLGGDRSATEVDDAGVNNVFDYVTEDEAAAGSVKYRCTEYVNTSASIWFNVYAWVAATLGNTVKAIGIDATTQSVANEDTAPSGVNFSSPLTKGAGIEISNVAAGGSVRIWERRTVNAGATIIADNGITYLEGGNAP